MINSLRLNIKGENNKDLIKLSKWEHYEELLTEKGPSFVKVTYHVAEPFGENNADEVMV